ncbi:hypothetical protein ACFL0W_05530 [Nanoarchaeota archaeon]
MEEHLTYTGKSIDDYEYYKLNFGKYGLEIKIISIIVITAIVLILI